MQDRIDQELVLLRQRYPGLDYRQDGQWVCIPAYPMPTGWDRSSTDVAFQIPIGYPGTPAYGIWTPEGLLFDGQPPDNCTAAQPIPPFGGTWLRFSWQPEGWQPAAEVTAGSNLLNWVRRLWGTVPPGEMTAMVIVSVPGQIYRTVRRHLLPSRRRVEEAAFLYVVPTEDAFEYLEWFPVTASGFASRSAYHLELNDDSRAKVIKRAHDLGASIVEMHSHLGQGRARFSPSDIAGFRDFVPHVLWRLKHLPYLAVVMTRTGFDGFAWKCDPDAPERLHGIQVGNRLLTPTNLSPLPDDTYDG